MPHPADRIEQRHEKRLLDRPALLLHPVLPHIIAPLRQPLPRRLPRLRIIARQPQRPEVDVPLQRCPVEHPWEHRDLRRRIQHLLQKIRLPRLRQRQICRRPPVRRIPPQLPPRHRARKLIEPQLRQDHPALRQPMHRRERLVPPVRLPRIPVRARIHRVPHRHRLIAPRRIPRLLPHLRRRRLRELLHDLLRRQRIRPENRVHLVVRIVRDRITPHRERPEMQPLPLHPARHLRRRRAKGPAIQKMLVRPRIEIRGIQLRRQNLRTLLVPRRRLRPLRHLRRRTAHEPPRPHRRDPRELPVRQRPVRPRRRPVERLRNFRPVRGGPRLRLPPRDHPAARMHHIRQFLPQRIPRCPLRIQRPGLGHQMFRESIAHVLVYRCVAVERSVGPRVAGGQVPVAGEERRNRRSLWE